MESRSKISEEFAILESKLIDKTLIINDLSKNAIE
jgi:hypothetical protein